MECSPTVGPAICYDRGMLRIVPFILLAAAAVADDIHVFSHPAMGSEFEVRIVASHEVAEEAAAEVFELIDALEEEISSWRETSYTTYVNRHAAEAPVRVSPNVLELFSESKKLSEQSFGAFDPTIGPLLDVWKIRSGGETPSDDAIAVALDRVGMGHIHINEPDSTIAYDREGVWVDWGAVGKGYALDRIAKRFRDHGIESALLSAGTSTIIALNPPPGDAGWAVQVPTASASAASGIVHLANAALSTSVCFESAMGPCDILDPRSGRAVSVASSATVIAETGLAADALSTALLVMRRDEAERFFADYLDIRARRIAAGGTPETYNWND